MPTMTAIMIDNLNAGSFPQIVIQNDERMYEQQY